MSAERVRQQRIAMLLRPAANQQSHGKQKHHDLIQHPAMARPADHQSVSVSERGWENGDGQHLDEVCQRRRVLIRMSPIGVEESTTVRAQVLDDFQRGHRPLSDGLPRAVESGGLSVRVEIHRHTLPRQKQRSHHRQRQQHPKDRAHQVNPEVAEGGSAIARHATNEGDSDRQAGCACKKVLHREAHDLAEVAHGGFAAIGLPGSCGSETDGGVHRQVGRHRCSHVGGIEPGEKLLQAQDDIEKQRAHHAEDHKCAGILLPGHFRLRRYSRQAIEQALRRT